MKIDECHMEFEKWAKVEDLDLSPSPKEPNRYQWNTTRYAWKGWKAAWDTKRESINQPMKTAPIDGSRMRLLHKGIEFHGWYEGEGFGFLGMDSEWGLVKLEPNAWAPLPEIEDQTTKEK